MESTIPYRTYWIVWGVLLALTLVMVVVEGSGVPRVAAVLFLIFAMLLKASFIGGWFMHLKFESPALVASVVGGALITAAVLFFLLVPDALDTLHNAIR